MIVSTRGRYALRVMLDINKHQDEEGYIPLRQIAERQNISPKYLETIMGQLQRAGLVVGARGKGGGYRLARDAKDYRIIDILEVTENTLAPVACLEKGADVNDCPIRDECLTLPMWKKLQQTIGDFFTDITLEDLAEGRIEA